jgi:DNA-binding protein HU-beta
MPAKRTIHRTSTGKKLYALRNAKGQIQDIQTYKKAHGQDVRRKAKSEGKAKKKR